jgi:hypothetical protein
MTKDNILINEADQKETEHNFFECFKIKDR